MAFTVLSKHLKTLNRRLNYLSNLSDDQRNTYDAAEISALHSALSSMEMVKSWEDHTGVEFSEELQYLLETEDSEDE